MWLLIGNKLPKKIWKEKKEKKKKRKKEEGKDGINMWQIILFIYIIKVL